MRSLLPETDIEVSDNDGKNDWNTDTIVTNREDSVLRTEVKVWKRNYCGMMAKRKKCLG
jgi:hypothetical protein